MFDKVYLLVDFAGFEQPNEPIETQKSLQKTLSFTERIELIERDVLNEFKIDIPIELLTQSNDIGMSQESIVLSDDEVNYSMTLNKFDNKEGQNGLSSPNIDFDSDFGESDGIECDMISKSVCELLEKTFDHHDTKSKESPRASKLSKTQSEFTLQPKYSELTRSLMNDSIASVRNDPVTTLDLSTKDYIIRTGDVPPKPNYEAMEIAELQSELSKFGLKQSLKRRQAIICLEYIYNRTHPRLENILDEKTESNPSVKATNNKAKANENTINFNIGFARDNLVDAKFKRTSIERYFLPSNPRGKRPWCIQPLHIAWHNLIKANSELFTAVINYSPIDLKSLKNYFKSIEMNFDNKVRRRKTHQNSNENYDF